MKYIYYNIVLFLWGCQILNAQIPVWQWAKSAGSINLDRSNGITSDNYGNSYITGFAGGIYFDSIYIDSYYYIAKYTNQGDIEWAHGITGNGIAEGLSIVSDNYGYIYVTGRCGDTVIFENDTIIGSSCLFITKYNTQGDVIWSKGFDGINGSQRGNSIITDIYGNIYVTGYFGSDTLDIGNTNLINQGTDDIFIAKLDSSGNVEWAKGFGGIYDDNGSDISVDSFGNVYVTGTFLSPSIIIDSIELVNKSHYDPFVLKLNNNGNAVWCKNFGGYGPDYSYHVVNDSSGNLYLSGIFQNDTLQFSSLTLIDSSGLSGYSNFLVKLDSSGNSLWGKSWSQNSMFLEDMIVDSDNNLLITGLYNGSTFVCNFDSSGDSLWTVQSFCSISHGITVDVSGNIVITGTFGDYCVFGTDTITNVEIGSWWEDIFVAKLSNSVSGINIKTNNNSLIIFPNPVTDNLTIDFHKDISNQSEFRIEINDISGRINRYATIHNNESLNISTLLPGVYIIKVYNDRDVAVGKFIKE